MLSWVYMIKKTALIILSSFALAACTPSGPITGTEQQKQEKLAQIIEAGGSADCIITNLADKSTTQMIISGKKMKIIGSDFGGGKKGTMINDNVYTYTWTEGEKTGFKMKLVTEKETAPTTAAQEEGKVDAEQAAQEFEDETKFKTDCTVRNIGASEFVPPSDVKFTDFSQINKMIPQGY